jgi:hypothetical protein
MVLSQVKDIASLQTLQASVGDATVVEGYYAPADGGGGSFAFQGLSIVEASLKTASIVSASGDAPIVITTAGAHGLASRQAVLISGVSGGSANGAWTITSLSPTRFSLDGSTGTSAAVGGAVNSVVVKTSAAHGLVVGQRVSIAGNSAQGFNGIYHPVGVSLGATTEFSIPCSVEPGQGGSFGDLGRSVPSSVGAGQWLRIDHTLNPRFYGARCDNFSDDSAALQAMIDANPGGRYLLPGSLAAPATIFMGDTSLFMKGAGWTLEGGGTTYGASSEGGTTLRWNAGATGIVTTNASGAGTIRSLSLLGGERFTAANNAAWPDAILPDFTDRIGNNIFSRSLEFVSRKSNVVTVGTQPPSDEPHTYVIGTQITLSGVSGHSELEGTYYITSVGQDAAGAFRSFSYVCPGRGSGREPRQYGALSHPARPSGRLSRLVLPEGDSGREHERFGHAQHRLDRPR